MPESVGKRTQVLTVFNPGRRGSILVQHQDLDGPDAYDLAEIYRALGHKPEHIVITEETAAQSAA